MEAFGCPLDLQKTMAFEALLVLQMAASQTKIGYTGIPKKLQEMYWELAGFCHSLLLLHMFEEMYNTFQGPIILRSPVLRYQCGEFQFHFIWVQLKKLQSWTALSSQLLGCSWK